MVSIGLNSGAGCADSLLDVVSSGDAFPRGVVVCMMLIVSVAL